MPGITPRPGPPRSACLTESVVLTQASSPLADLAQRIRPLVADLV